VKANDFIAMLLFTWTCALGATAIIVALGVPWSYALSHTIPSCLLGTGISALLSHVVARWVRRIEAAQEAKS